MSCAFLSLAPFLWLAQTPRPGWGVGGPAPPHPGGYHGGFYPSPAQNTTPVLWGGGDRYPAGVVSRVLDSLPAGDFEGSY